MPDRELDARRRSSSSSRRICLLVYRPLRIPATVRRRFLDVRRDQKGEPLTAACNTQATSTRSDLVSSARRGRCTKKFGSLRGEYAVCGTGRDVRQDLTKWKCRPRGVTSTQRPSSPLGDDEKQGGSDNVTSEHCLLELFSFNDRATAKPVTNERTNELRELEIMSPFSNEITNGSPREVTTR